MTAERLICDLTQSWSDVGGGVGTYLRHKRNHILERTPHRHLLLVPGPEDTVAEDGRAIRATIRSPRVPGSPHYRLMLRKQLCAKLAYDAVNLMMRTNGSAGMRGGAMWQRYQRDLTVLMTHNTVQPELAADSFGRMHFGLLPHGVEEGSGPAPPPVR